MIDPDIAPRIVMMHPFVTAGLVYRGKAEHGEIQALWAEFMARLDELASVRVNEQTMGVARRPADGQPGEVEYLAGAQVAWRDNLPPGMVAWSIPSASYAAFLVKGSPETAHALFFKEWLPRTTEWELAAGAWVENRSPTFAQDQIVEVCFPIQSKREPVAEIVVGQAREQTTAGFTLLSLRAATSTDQVDETVRALGQQLDQLLTANSIATVGPSVTIYYTAQRRDRLIIEVGSAVAPGTLPVGAAQVREVRPFHCAALVYSGPYRLLETAYRALHAAMRRAGLKPSGEQRDYYLYEEDDESPNNVVLVQMGIED